MLPLEILFGKWKKILFKAKGILKKDPDGIDSNGAKWYKIEKLHKDEVTPFVLYGLEKLGYKLL